MKTLYKTQREEQKALDAAKRNTNDAIENFDTAKDESALNLDEVIQKDLADATATAKSTETSTSAGEELVAGLDQSRKDATAAVVKAKNSYEKIQAEETLGFCY